MDEPDPWGELGARYQHDDGARFVMFVEQFAETASLVRSSETAKLRMALVATDNLAEMVLARHVRNHFRVADAGGWSYRGRRFANRERRKLSREFGAKVSLGAWTDPADTQAWPPPPAPVLDAVDEPIFRVAHAYRNRIYHADHHNTAVLPLIARAYVLAVGRAFVRSQPRNVASSYTPARPQLEQVGYTPPSGGAFPGYFAPAEAAEQITTHLTQAVSVDLREAGATLRADISWRARWARAMMDHLVKEGMERDRLLSGLAWGVATESLERDRELDRLDSVRVAAWENVRTADDETAAREAAELADREYSDRFFALMRGRDKDIDLDEIDRTERQGSALESAQDLGALFKTYHELDRLIEPWERRLDDAAIGWERYLDEELDRLRGR